MFQNTKYRGNEFSQPHIFRLLLEACQITSANVPSCSELQWRGVDCFTHTAFIYMFTVSDHSHHFRRPSGDGLHQSQLRSLKQTTNRKKKVVIFPFILSLFSFGAKLLNDTRLASYLVREWCGRWISGDLVVKSRKEEPCSACMSCQQIC